MAPAIAMAMAMAMAMATAAAAAAVAATGRRASGLPRGRPMVLRRESVWETTVGISCVVRLPNTDESKPE